MKINLPPTEAIDTLNRSWIWGTGPARAYNASAWFRRDWVRNAKQPVHFALTADTRFRLYVNGQWVLDGPVRGWPEEWRADWVDITRWLKPGKNRIEVLVHFFGSGTFHVIPRRAGFSAALYEGDRELFRTDKRWRTRPAGEYVAEAPRISVQLPPMEIYDARQHDSEAWIPSVPIPSEPPPPVVAGWRDVTPPSPSPLTISTRPAVKFVTQREGITAIPVLRLLHPNVFTEAIRMSRPLGLVTEITARTETLCDWFDPDHWRVYVDGVRVDPARWTLTRGTHRVAALYTKFFDDRVDAVFGPPQSPQLRYRRPQWAPSGHEVWVAVSSRDLLQQGDDHFWVGHPSAFHDQLDSSYQAWCDRVGASTRNARSFGALSEEILVPADGCPLFFQDPEAEFRSRQVVGVEAETPATNAPLPRRQGAATELHYDLQDQKAGFVCLDIEAPRGTVLDVHLVEHIREDGTIQHTSANRNGFRVITTGDRLRFLSRQRRSGRHLFLSVKSGTGAIRIRDVGMVESGYPARCADSFESSDVLLNRIWEASRRTMELSMDDVYIDSLYEQTLWVGDARVEQLYGLRTFDARDLSLRSLRLPVASLKRAPMILSQVPSCWENILPNWSFLWGIAVWEYYDYTGETSVLRELWPAVLKNLRGASFQLNENSLFEAPWWNLFEWADVDNNQRVVLYNSLFFLGAVQAARQIAAVLDDLEAKGWLASLENRLRWGIETLWNPKKKLYVESTDRSGKPSRRFSIHPQFLAVLFGAADPERARHLLDLIGKPHAGLEGLASPFALQFYGEALDRAGRRAEILQLLREYFAPMVEIGTTLWEALPDSRTTPPGFPTRSHCHGWSCCALDFLQLITLGIRSTEPGSRRFLVSPEPHGLTHAKGARATPFGPIHVTWSISGRRIQIDVVRPPEVEVSFQKNTTLAGLKPEVRIRQTT